MDNWILKGAKNLVNELGAVSITSPSQVKVKVSHLLMTDFDKLVFDGTVETNYPRILGRAAVGIVTETGDDCYGLEKGTRVYLNPTRACGECFQCKTGKPKDCTAVLTAGKDFDGFMRDFVVCEYGDVAPLPDSVDDFHALCIETVAIAENIYDKLQLSAGQKVAVVGADFTGNILAQVLQYHKVIPIIIDNSPANLERAKKCGIFFAFSADDDLERNVLDATSGELCSAAVFCANSKLPVSVTTRLVSEGKTVVLGFTSTSDSVIEVRDILRKNITLTGVSTAYDYTDAVINMLVHNAVNTDYFEKKVLTEYDPAELLANPETFKAGRMTILKMII